MKFIKQYGLIIIGLAVTFGFRQPILGSIIMLAGGLIQLSSLMSRHNSLKKNGIECDGTIVDIKKNSDDNKVLVIEFKTLSGEQIRGESTIYSSSEKNPMELNQSIPVIYNPTDPKEFAAVATIKGGNILLIILIVSGAAFLILALLQYFGYIHLTTGND